RQERVAVRGRADLLAPLLECTGSMKGVITRVDGLENDLLAISVAYCRSWQNKTIIVPSDPIDSDRPPVNPDVSDVVIKQASTLHVGRHHQPSGHQLFTYFCAIPGQLFMGNCHLVHDPVGISPADPRTPIFGFLISR